MTSHKNEANNSVVNAKSGGPTDLSKEYLLAEYKHFSESFWRNEEIGEKRLNFFITLVTAVIAALVALKTKGGETFSINDAAPFLRPGILVLLIFGLVTLLRMIKRNIVTDEFKAKIHYIRCYFKNLDPETLCDYMPFGCDPCTEKKGTGNRKYLSGGMVEIVVAINSIIAAGFGYLLAIPDQKKFAIVYGMIGFAISLVFQLVIINIKTTPKPFGNNKEASKSNKES